MALYEEFGERLDKALKLAGLSQNGLADELTKACEKRVYASVVNRWVKGEAIPEGRYMVKLPTILKVNGHWLLTEEGEPRARLSAKEKAQLEALDHDYADRKRRRALDDRESPKGETRRHPRAVRGNLGG